MRFSIQRTQLAPDTRVASTFIATAIVIIAFVMLLFLSRGNNLHLFILLLLTLPAVGLAITDSRYLLPYILAMWAFAPELRRIADWWSLSYQELPLVSLVPLVVTTTLIIALYSRSVRLSGPLRKAFVCFALALVYGGLLGVAKHGAAGIYELGNYLFPLMLVLYGVARRTEPNERDLWIKSYILFAVLVSIYAWIQFLVVPPWDAFWMNHCGMTTIGIPKPFLIRVFSTLNTPGHAATLLGMALAVLLLDKRFRGALGWLWIVLISSAMLITLVRGIWLMFFAFLIASILAAKGKARWKLIGGIVAAGVVITLLVPVLPGGGQIVKRMTTVQNLGSDQSFGDRQSFVFLIIPRIIANPFGSGTGVIGIGSKLSSSDPNSNYAAFDNGFLATFMTFGLLGGGLFFAALGYLAQACRQVERVNPPLAGNARLALGAIAYIVAALVFGSPIPGLGGALMYFFVAAAIGKPIPPAEYQLKKA